MLVAAERDAIPPSSHANPAHAGDTPLDQAQGILIILHMKHDILNTSRFVDIGPTDVHSWESMGLSVWSSYVMCACDHRSYIQCKTASFGTIFYPSLQKL